MTTGVVDILNGTVLMNDKCTWSLIISFFFIHIISLLNYLFYLYYTQGEKVEENYEEIKQIFTLFDRDGDGKVEMSELGTVLRAAGRLPNESEISELKMNLAAESFTFPDLVLILSKLPVTDPKTLRSALLDAFSVFDRAGSGEIGTEELKHIMTSLGEKLSEEEAGEMVKLADPNGSGVIRYENFVDKLVMN